LHREENNMNTLKQRKLFTLREFELVSKGVLLKYKDISGYYELTKPYIEITKDIKIIKTGGRGWLIASGIFVIIALILFIDRLTGGSVEKNAEIIWISISLICFCIFTIKHTSIMQLMCTDGDAIVFFYNEKNREELGKFIQSIFKERDKYLKDKYTKIDMDFPKEENLYKIEWLKNQEIISEDEYNELKKTILNYEKLNCEDEDK